MKGKIPAGRVTSAVAANMDILPTFAALAGAELPTDRVLDGRDLWPLLSGKTEQSPHEYFYFFAGSGRDRPPSLEAIRRGRYKLHLDSEFGPVALYDLYADAGEKFDIKERHPEVLEKLTAQAKTFVEELKKNTRPLGRS